ncbi:MAG TPA: VanW family protein [Patescibacteria group bacterium]
MVQKIESWLIGLTLGLLVVGAGASLWFFTSYQGRFYQGIYLDGVDLSGLTKDEALIRLTQAAPAPPAHSITLQVDDIQLSSSSAELAATYSYLESLDEAYAIGRTGFLLTRLVTIIQTRINPVTVQSWVKYDQEKLHQFIAEYSKKVNIEGEAPQAELLYSNTPDSLTIHPGKPGRKVKSDEVFQELQMQPVAQNLILTTPIASTAGELSEEQVVQAGERAKKLIGESITFTAKEENITRTLHDQILISLLAFPDLYQEEMLQRQLDELAAAVNRPTQDAQFEYNPETLAVTTFKPHRNGLELDREETYRQLVTRLIALEAEAQKLSESEDTAQPTEESATTKEPIALKLTITEPTLTLEETNNLGIKELIGFGDSEYDHSIPTRIHNVAHTAKKINLMIIPPDQEFSFNKALGEVSRATGFQPAYVIKNGRTELGDGGGVCQVSTTLFRAVLNAGLPVTKRKAHSYRVSYYELNAKPGIDATVYAGDVDLRFINDTGHHVLVYMETDSEDLYMKVELYGTSDGRTTEIVDHEVWDARPAPAPVFIPDPSLPPGVRRQIDWSVGGVKARFKNIVKDKDGNVIREEEYYSNYVPWSAKYLVGV